jgi:hypothetical protein
MRIPKTSIGPVTTHAIVCWPTPNSRAIDGKTAVRIVIEMPVEKKPSKSTTSAHQR